MKIDVSLMKGEVPRLKEHLLPNEASTNSVDCDFERGIVAPFFNDSDSETLPRAPRTLFRYTDEYWFTFPDVGISAIHSPMAQDDYQRAYWTGQSVPKITTADAAIGGSSGYPAAWFDLGIPRPASPPTIDNVDDSTGDKPDDDEPNPYDTETRIYIQTYVSALGEEGGPGEASEEVEIEFPGTTVTIGLTTPGQNSHNITHTRLYRSVTASGVTDMVLIAELPITQNSYVDSARTVSGPVLETWDFEVPPVDMQGLCIMANGICAGFTGNAVMFSEAFLPYAWPLGYRSTTDSEIVAIAPIGTSLVVATKGHPYIFSGVTPAAINGQKTDIEQSCVSSSSMVVISGAAIYASPYGLIAVGSAGASNLTEELITKEQWKEFRPETIKAWAIQGLYIAQYEGGAFIFDPISRSFNRLSNRWDTGYSDLESDSLYVCTGDQLRIWKGGSTKKDFTWKSKVFQMPKDSFLTCARVQADEPSEIGLRVMLDGVEIVNLNKGQVGDSAFWLPPLRGDKWQFELNGASEVERVLIADSMEELA